MEAPKVEEKKVEEVPAKIEVTAEVQETVEKKETTPVEVAPAAKPEEIKKEGKCLFFLLCDFDIFIKRVIF